MSDTAPSLSLLRRGWARGLDLRALAQSALPDAIEEEPAGHHSGEDERTDTGGSAAAPRDSEDGR